VNQHGRSVVTVGELGRILPEQFLKAGHESPRMGAVEVTPLVSLTFRDEQPVSRLAPGPSAARFAVNGYDDGTAT
jgi:hypothetical protein